MVRARDAMHRHTTGHATALTQETEAQKKQWERLLMQREDAKKAGDGSTFKLDWPGPLDRQSTMDTLRNLPRAARNVYDNRGASVYGRPDLVAQPTAMEPQMDPVQEEEIAVRTETEPLPATAYVPPNYDDQILNTPYTTLQTSSAPTPNPNLPRLEGNGYPLEKPPSEPLDTQHPAQRQYNQYHLVSEDQPSLMQRLAQPEAQGRNLNREISSNRESRRTEIELTERDGTRDEENRADLGDVEVIRRIGRVETDGWGRRHG
ncbi:hypothetical protein MMC21_004916 [Puttea exsequens]|nr:hypothetical protein [Puttea exsequens]